MKKTGFTLTEIIVASVILATAVAGLWASFIASKRYTVSSEAHIMAVHNAKYILEQLRNDVRIDTWDTGNLREPINNMDITTWLPSGSDTFRTKYDGTANYTVSAVPGYNCRRVDLTMSWISE